MSRMLNLAEALLGRGRTHQQLGRVHDAFAILSRLSRFRELPQSVAEETQARLGEIQLKRKKFGRACRHLQTALNHDPENSRYHHLLAGALREQDPDQWERAAEHYRRALELNPDQVESLVELGLLSVRNGHADEGIAHLRRAAELQQDDPEVLGKLVKGLRWTGRSAEARGALRAAMFRHPHDRRFQQLWSDFQFRMLRRQQRDQASKRSGSNTEPVLLPFVSVSREREATRPAEGIATVPVARVGRTLPGLDQRHAR
jgi:tetratricopeptide (TPR) repeat protein